MNEIEHRKIRIRTPRTNGFVERFNGTELEEFFRPAMRAKLFDSIEGLQADLDAWLHHYNHERPHDAVDHAPPATRYSPSCRPLPSRLPALEYPLEWAVRRVWSNGAIKWHGRSLFVTRTLAAEDVAFEPLDDGVWMLRFAAFPLAVFDERTWRLKSPDRSSPPQALRS